MKRICTSCLIALILVCFARNSFSQNLQLNLKEGETYFQNSKADISMKQNIAGQPMNITMNVEGKMGFLVKEKQSEVFVLEARYHALSFSTTTPYGVFEYSSEKGEDPNDIMSTILSKIINHTFEVRMRSNGSIEEILHLKEMFEELFNDFPEVAEMQKTQMASQLNQFYGEDALKSNIELITSIYPDHEVAVNDTWKNEITIGAGMNLIVDSEFTLKEYTDEYGLIEVSSVSKTPEEQEYQEVSGMPTRYKMNGTMTGIIRINSATGWIEQGEIQQNFAGSVEIADNPQVPGGMIIPMEMANKTTIKNN